MTTNYTIRQPDRIPITPETTIVLAAIATTTILFLIYLIWRKGNPDQNAKTGAHHKQNYNLTTKEAENLLKNSMISFAIMVILGYILPFPYNSFTLFITAIAFIISGALNQRKLNQQKPPTHHTPTNNTLFVPTCVANNHVPLKLQSDDPPQP